VSTRESYRTIQASLCRSTNSVEFSISSDEPEEALRKTENLKDGLNAAWETVLADKTGQMVLLDAIESLISSINLQLGADKSDNAVAAVIRYLDPDQNGNSLELDGR
jgi:hypothetical protein